MTHASVRKWTTLSKHWTTPSDAWTSTWIEEEEREQEEDDKDDATTRETHTLIKSRTEVYAA